MCKARVADVPAIRMHPTDPQIRSLAGQEVHVNLDGAEPQGNFTYFPVTSVGEKPITTRINGILLKTLSPSGQEVSVSSLFG